MKTVWLSFEMSSTGPHVFTYIECTAAFLIMSPSFQDWFEFDHLGHWSKMNTCVCNVKMCAHKYVLFHFNIKCVSVCVCVGVGVTLVVINHSITHLSEFRQVGERGGGKGEGGRNAAEQSRRGTEWMKKAPKEKEREKVLLWGVWTSRDRGKLSAAERLCSEDSDC